MQKLLSGYRFYARNATTLFKFFDRVVNLRFPLHVRIESTNLCNSDCVTCPRSLMTRKKGVMDFDLYSKAIDECSKYKVHRIHLHNFGEPLLDRELIRKIKYAKDRGLKVRIFSNLSILTPEQAEGLITSGLDDLKISFDGYTKETFEGIRKRLRFEDVVNNIKMLIEMRNRLKSRTPGIGLTFVETPLNSGEKDLFLREWRGIADNVIVTKFHNWGGEIQSKPKEKLIPCPRLWTTFTILWNGDVALCCMDFDGKVVLGNVKEKSIFDIYHSDEIKKIRGYHINWQYDKVPICTNCDLRK